MKQAMINWFDYTCGRGTVVLLDDLMSNRSKTYDFSYVNLTDKDMRLERGVIVNVEIYYDDIYGFEIVKTLSPKKGS